MRGMSAAVVTTLGSLLMRDGDTGPRSFANIQWRTVAAEHIYGRPFGQHRDWRRRVRCKIIRRVNNLSSNNGKSGFDAFDFFF